MADSASLADHLSNLRRRATEGSVGKSGFVMLRAARKAVFSPRMHIKSISGRALKALNGNLPFLYVTAGPRFVARSVPRAKPQLSVEEVTEAMDCEGTLQCRDCNSFRWSITCYPGP